jgi:predicted nucleotidyltransferase component of viral defense system
MLNPDLATKQNRYSIIDRIPLSPKNDLSESEKESFPGARFVDSLELDDHPEEGRKTVIRILKTSLKYPYIRIEEEVDPETNFVINKAEMVADHLLITFEKGTIPEEFHKKLHSLVPFEASLREIYDLLYQLNFEKTDIIRSFSQILKASRSLGNTFGTATSPDCVSS